MRVLPTLSLVSLPASGCSRPVETRLDPEDPIEPGNPGGPVQDIAGDERLVRAYTGFGSELANRAFAPGSEGGAHHRQLAVGAAGNSVSSIRSNIPVISQCHIEPRANVLRV